MKYSPYSVSRIALWNQCPRKFKYSYIDKIPRDIKDPYHLHKGFCTHLFLENHITKMSSKDLVRQIKRENISNDVVEESKEIYKRFIKGSLGERLLSYYPLGTEVEVGLKIDNKKLVTCDFLDSDCIFRGKIDYICVDRDTDKVYVIDWKTGKDKSSGDFSMTPDQLIYYAVWYFHNFPVDEITLMYVFVEHDTKSEFIIKRDALNTYIKFLLRNINNIEKDTSFNKIQNALCYYCEYKGHCINDN